MEIGNLEQSEWSEKRDPQVAYLLLLDTSDSMHGECIAELNAMIQSFKDEVLKDPVAVKRIDLAIMTFASEVNLIRDFGGTIESFEPPILTPSAQKQKLMGKAIIDALNKIEERKAQYRDLGLMYYRPWLFLITDGLPEGEPNEVIEEARSRLHVAVTEKKVAMFAVGVGDVDLSRLKDIAGTEPLHFRRRTDFRNWIRVPSVSLSNQSRFQPGDMVNLPPPPPDWIIEA